MYLECRICGRVTQHKKVDTQARSYRIGDNVVSMGVFYICPHCNTGVSGTEITSNITSNIKSSFESDGPG